MMRALGFGLVAAIGGLAVGPTHAEELTNTAHGYDWTGIYLGVQGGYGWGSNTYIYTPASSDNDTGVGFDGFVGGATLGSNWQYGNIVLGLEGDLSASRMEGEVHTDDDVPCYIEGCTAEVDWFGTARVRLGYSVNNLLPYASAGLAVGGVRGSADHGACDPFSSCDFDGTRMGFALGGGLELAVNQNWSLKAEYLYVNLAEPSFDNATTQSENVDFGVVRAGVNFRF